MRPLSNVFTTTLETGESLTIAGDMNISKISFIVLSGTCTYKGNAKLLLADGTQLDSENITFTAGMVNTITSIPDAPFDGITISATGNVGIELMR
jgi:hypothetical protein